MAKNSGIGDIVTLAIIGGGVWLVGDLFGWWADLFGTATTATTPTTTTTGTTTTAPAAATVQLASAVTPTLNNALQATFVINGASEQIAVIPNGDAYNNSGEDITTELAAEGVTPAQLYAIMAANYTPPKTTTPTTTSTTTTTTTPAGAGASNNARLAGNLSQRLTAIGLNKPAGRGASGYGMGGPMVYATRKNYVRKGTSF